MHPKRGYKIFSMFKGHGPMWKIYKTSCIEVFHILVHLTILKLQYVLPQTNTLQTFYPIFFPQKGIPMD